MSRAKITKPRKRTQIYLGLGLAGAKREIFRSSVEPTEQTHGHLGFAACVGPFRTLLGAKFMRDHGKNNPHCVTVNDAERLAREQTTQCPRCFGRGYVPEYRKSGQGFYARNCPRCSGSGSVQAGTRGTS